MVAACPRCKSRFRIGAERLRDEGVRLRCTQCQGVFRVYPPRTEAPRRRDDPSVDAELTPPPRPTERERMVLIADPDPARAKACAAEIVRLGLHPLMVHDGVDALLTLQRALPARVVADSGLPRLSGIELCEVVKRNESLCSTRFILCGDAAGLAGAGVLRSAGLGPDSTLEHADLPEGLHAALRFEGADPSPTGSAETPAERGHLDSAALRTPEAGVSPQTPPPAAAEAAPRLAAEADPDVARAERLARIAVSDIALYNPERFDRAVREGDVLEALAGELAEARKMLRQRVPGHLCDERDFVADELLRVAGSRAAR